MAEGDCYSGCSLDRRRCATVARGGGAWQRHGGTRLCAAARGGGVRAARAGECWHRRAGVELMQSAGAVAGCYERGRTAL
eukprot:scaffold94732_cov63-Phaeocystis_antarctica.AAC.3